MSESHVFDQLACVVIGYPLWPGDTISHQLADECCRRGWIVRDQSGCWIPTAAGIVAYGEHATPQPEPRP